MHLPDNFDFIKGNTVAGIHAIINPDSSLNMNIIILKRYKKKMRIEKNFADISEVNKIKSFIPKNIPICLSLEGKGIIHRKISRVNSSDLINQILPNARQSDFYIQSRAVGSGRAILSLIRFDSLNEVLNLFNGEGYFLWKLFLGPFSLNSFWPLVKLQSTLSGISGYNIKFTNDIITDIEFTGETDNLKEFSILQDIISINCVIPYANAASFFIGQNIDSFNQLGSIPALGCDDYLYKRYFRFVSLSLIIALFFSLLINFIFFNYYKKELNQETKQYKSGLELIGELEKLKKDLNVRENLVKESGILQQSRISYFADRIGSLLPAEIALIRMEINPLLNRPKKEQEIAVNKNTMKINGICTHSMVLNNWMEVLKEEKWIHYIEVLQYKQEEMGTPGEFILLIDLQ
jgi:hypothetical protein